MAKEKAPPDLTNLLSHAGWLGRIARHLAGDDLADDVLQETWHAALVTPPDSDRPERPWLVSVLRNFVRKHRRGEGRRRLRETEAAQCAPGSEDGPELLARMQLQRDLVDQVMALAEPYRTTIVLRYFENRSAAEIARQAQIPAGTVR